jgi:hypothetical protein
MVTPRFRGMARHMEVFHMTFAAAAKIGRPTTVQRLVVPIGGTPLHEARQPAVWAKEPHSLCGMGCSLQQVVAFTFWRVYA